MSLFFQFVGMSEFLSGIAAAAGLQETATKEAGGKSAEFIVSRLSPDHVGSGAGAHPKPKISGDAAMILAGYAGRSRRALQWGKVQEWEQSGAAPERPYIVQQANSDIAVIEKIYLDKVKSALVPPFI